MELKKLSEHIWFMPYESERDRPNLGYVKGDKWSLARLTRKFCHTPELAYDRFGITFRRQ